MTKQAETLFGLIIFIGVIIALGIGLIYTVPADSEVAQKRTVSEDKLMKPDTNILNTGVADKIKALEVNGQVPVVVSPNDIGRANPFTPY